MNRDHPNPTPLRIGIFIALLPPEHLGGAELQADRLARELVERGHEVHIFARRQAGRKSPEWRNGVRVHRRPVLPVPGLRLVQETVSGGIQGSRHDLDVFLCFMTLNSALLGYAAHLFRRRPFIIWQRAEAECLLHPPSFRTRLSCFLNRRAAAIWVQSQRMVEKLQQEYLTSAARLDWPEVKGRVRILGNGVDLPELREEEVPPRRFVFVGRLVEEKNLFMLLDAFRPLQSSELWIVGSGPLANRLQEAAADLDNRVRFLGSLAHERVIGTLWQSRALVLSSREEGLPNVVLESLAGGRPVVSTDVGGVRELITDGVNGRLVSPGDVEGLSRAMREMEDDDRWKTYARAAQPSVKHFSWPELVRRVESELMATAERSTTLD